MASNFNHPDLGLIRYHKDSRGVLWFCAEDVAQGMGGPLEEVPAHCKALKPMGGERLPALSKAGVEFALAARRFRARKERA
jgi:hypothetical protein